MNAFQKQQVEYVLSLLKQELLEIMWTDCTDEFNNQRILLPWLQEDATYSIKRLQLSQQKETLYLTKIERIMSEYFEE